MTRIGTSIRKTLAEKPALDNSVRGAESPVRAGAEITPNLIESLKLLFFSLLPALREIGKLATAEVSGRNNFSEMEKHRAAGGKGKRWPLRRTRNADFLAYWSLPSFAQERPVPPNRPGNLNTASANRTLESKRMLKKTAPDAKRRQLQSARRCRQVGGKKIRTRVDVGEFEPPGLCLGDRLTARPHAAPGIWASVNGAYST